MEPVTAYLGLGTNLGNRENNLTRAAQALGESPALTVTRASSIYETAPWGYANQPDFLNCVLEVTTTLEPAPLLRFVKEVEDAMGREPSLRYGPRLIDIDILLYGNQTISLDCPDLQIPHLRLSQRAFVLVPLEELAAEAIHPTAQLTVNELAKRVEGKEGVKLLRPPLPIDA